MSGRNSFRPVRGLLRASGLMATPAGRQASLDRITRGSGLVAVFIGATALVGWATRVEALKSFVPGMQTMKANTAFCMILLGAAVGWSRVRTARRVVEGLALAAIAIAVASLGEYLSGRDLGINELVFLDPISLQRNLPPGRMSFATALGFTLIGSAILLVERRRPVVAQSLAFASVLIALFTSTAYLFGEKTVTMISPYTSLAVNTTLGMFALGVGVLGRCVEAGPMAVFVADDAGGRSLRWLLPISVGSTVFLGLLTTLGVRAGLHNIATALVIFAVEATVVLSVTIWRNSQTLSRSDADRRRELERFRLTLTSIGDAVIATDARGRVTFLNEVAVGLTGYSAEDAIGRPLAEVFRIVNEATKLPVEDPVAKVLATGHVVGLANHTALIARDGTERPIEDSAAPIKDEDGTTSGVVLVFHDVSEKKRSERMFKEHKRVLELIARGVPLHETLDALCLLIEKLSPDPLFAAFLLAGEDGSGWTVAAAPSLPEAYHRAINGVSGARGNGSIGKAAQVHEPVYVEDIATDPLWNDLADLASTHHLLDSWSCPIFSSRNEVIGVLAMHRHQSRPPSTEHLKLIDIALRTAAIAIERDRSKTELVDARTRLESALSAGSIATWTWDLVRDRVFPDAYLARLFSIPPENAAGSPVSEYLKAIHPDDLANVEQAINGAIAGTGEYDVEARIVQPDGTARSIVTRGQVERTPDGRPSVFSGVLVDITDRKQVEQEKDRLALLVEKSGEFIGIASLDGLVTYGNAATQRMMGIDDWEAVKHVPLADYFFPEDQSFFFDEFLPQVLEEGYARTEIRFRNPKMGDFLWLDFGVSSLRSKDGVAIGYAMISRDLSEQRKAVEELKAFSDQAESQARLFDSALSNTPDLSYTFDINGRFTYVNKALQRLWRKTPDEALGKTFFELDYTPELAAKLHAQVQEVIASKSRISDETPYTGAFGARNYEYIFTPVLSPDGSVEAVVGATRDITDRKQAEEASKLRAFQMQRLAEISARINAAHDVNSVIRVVSREALDLFGTHRAAISMVLNPDFPQPVNVVSTSDSGHDAVEVALPSLDRDALIEVLGRTNEPIRLTKAEIEADPTWRMLSRIGGDSIIRDGWLAAPLVSRNRKSMGLIQLSDKHDGPFTPEDEALLVQLSLLAAIAIENARLYEELRGNDQRKDEFLAMLAHELRNPLAAIGNAVKLLEAGFAEHAEWSMDVIGRQMHHLTRLIDDLLDVSRISRGKIELRRDLIDATPILESAAATVKALVEERKHTLEVAIDRGNLWVGADPTRLEQVVVNLLNNAAKYSENSGRIRLEARSESGQVVIQVSDQGMGIAPEKLPQMFELFAQGDRSLARSEGGLGIGLTVVKKLVEMHGGTISARSEGVGKGSDFTIRLPSASKPAATRTDAPTSPSTATEPRKARILVVDDNIDTARGMARLLKLIGHTIATAHSGPEAIEAARQHRPDFVLLDIGLPGMTGYEVAARLRQEESCQGAVIIAVSGYGQDEDRRRSKESGFDHHLIKPLDHDALLALLENSGNGHP